METDCIDNHRRSLPYYYSIFDKKDEEPRLYYPYYHKTPSLSMVVSYLVLVALLSRRDEHPLSHTLLSFLLDSANRELHIVIFCSQLHCL
jgi:hypothetical protein